ncbi:MAG: hypothetical protein AAGB14_07075 [Verrucomicrobiota bacterium]
MIRLTAIVLTFALCSCGLIQMPFRVVGGVTRGTARAVSKPVEAHKARKAKKEKEKAKEEAKKKKEEAARQQSGELPPDFFPPANDGNPDLESLDPDLPSVSQ